VKEPSSRFYRTSLLLYFDWKNTSSQTGGAACLNETASVKMLVSDFLYENPNKQKITYMVTLKCDIESIALL